MLCYAMLSFTPVMCNYSFLKKIADGFEIEIWSNVVINRH
jgi:hypothetical protein